MKPLPFGFARRFGVLLDDGHLIVRCDTSLSAIAEARRLTDHELPLRMLTVEDFATRLAVVYSEGQSAAKAWMMSWICSAWWTRCRRPPTCWSSKAMRRSYV